MTAEKVQKKGVSVRTAETYEILEIVWGLHKENS